MKVKSNKVGVCPICNKESLEYDRVEMGIDPCFDYYPWYCKECHAQGEEWYELKFMGHNIVDEDGELIEIEDYMIEKEDEENEEER